MSNIYLYHYYSTILHISTEKNKANVTVRNITSCTSFQVEINSALAKVPKNSKENLQLLTKLCSAEELSEVKEGTINEVEPQLSPEHILASLPLEIYNRSNEHLVGWEAIDPSPEIDALIESLDDIEIQTVHNIGVLFIPADCSKEC